MTMATVDEVTSLTGMNIGEADIAIAQSIVELTCGRAEADLKPRDQRWMKMAVAYQAAWMASHPEVFSTMDVSSMSQTDMSVVFRNDREAVYLAPLARKALRRVSWRGTRSIQVGSDFQSGKVDDHEGQWSSL